MISTHVQELLRRGVALQRAGKPGEAAACFGRACAQAPSDPLCGMALANVLVELGRHAEAEARLRPLAMRNPKLAELWDLWAVVLQRCGNMADSLRASQGAVAANPRLTGPWCNFALALLNTGRPSEALACLEKALALDPQCAAALHGRAMALQHLHRVPEALKAYGAAIARDPKNFETRSYRLFALHYLGIGRDLLWAEHREFGAACPPEEPMPAPSAAATARRLRLGFLSPDLREHSVAYFLEPLLEQLDRGEFEIVLYHDHYQVDAVSERLKARAGLWRNLVGMAHAKAAAQIRADRIDVLVDLAGHTGLNRMPVFARRAAPVQISYLGYPDTTGVPAMDYRFVDGFTDPEGEADRFASEKLVRFAPALWSYRPPAEAPAPAPRRSGPPAFGSCNNLAKVGEETMRGWARALAAAPGSVLRLKADGLERDSVAGPFRARAAAAGIDPARLQLQGRAAGIAEHLSFYHGIDVALDTFPYHGTTTTCEALWMGVPVISLEGDRHCSRVGASLLRAIGQAGWIASDWDGFARRAAALAAERPDRDEVRRALAASVLLDHPGQAARFGAAVRRCWQERLAGSASLAA